MECLRLSHPKKSGVAPNATAEVSIDSDVAKITFKGAWLLSDTRTDIAGVVKELNSDFVKKVSFDLSGVTTYDSSLISFLLRVYEASAQKNADFDFKSLPQGPRSLLRLAVAVPEGERKKEVQASNNLIGIISSRAMGVIDDFRSSATFVGEASIAAVKVARHTAHFRMCDLMMLIQRAGPEALPIVGFISFLVGMILGFVGVTSLGMYGSEIFVADLVGIAMVRELGAIMVAIVMAGRTGAAFAAELASMKVNEEISAYRTFGISPMEFLVIPRIIALTLMFPLLTIFADAIALMGGMVVSVGLSDVSMDQYINRTISALTLVQCSTGVGKSIVFGFIVAAVGCRMGMQAQTSSEGVGMATTSSVVESIKLIIITDAIFAIIFVIFGI